MPALIRGEEPSIERPKLDVFTEANGVRADVYSLSWQIFEKVSVPGMPTDVTGVVTSNLNPQPTGDKLDTGHYLARWTVPTDALIGTWEIRWYAKLLSDSPTQTFIEEFEVLAAASFSSSDTYISVADVRAAGLVSNPPDDARIQASIILWQQTLERATRQWFRPIELEFYLDGTDSDALHLPVPIISISEVRLNTDTTPLDPMYWRAYTGRLLPDDRKNPRIKLVGTWGFQRDIFTAPDRHTRWRFFKGRQNQYVKGVFGYLEPDDSVPQLIQRALLKLVLADLAAPLIPTVPTGLVPPPLTTGLVKEEWTDNHKITYQVAGGEIKSRAPGLSGLINDPEVQVIIKMYKAPIGMAAPANPTWT